MWTVNAAFDHISIIVVVSVVIVYVVFLNGVILVVVSHSWLSMTEDEILHPISGSLRGVIPKSSSHEELTRRLWKYISFFRTGSTHPK